MSDLKDLIRQCVSQFIDGTETEAILGAITDEALRQQKVALASFDQMYLSTASKQYVDKKAAEVGLIRPEEIGLSDFTFRNIAIDITATKQVTTLIHSVLETFYGPEAVRTTIITGLPEPYQLTEGQTLEWNMDGKKFVYEVIATDFPPGHLAQATSDELAAAITKYIRTTTSLGFAKTYIDPDTNEKFIIIFSGVLGPVGYMQFTGGELLRILDIDKMIDYPAVEPSPWTSWVVNRKGNTIRFSWYGNGDPHLEVVKEGDIALIYGDSFENVGVHSTDLRGAFIITKVQTGNVWNISTPETAAYFEVVNDSAAINSTENIVINQVEYNSLRYYRSKIIKPYFRKRYALAWEPTGKFLRVYLPATSGVVNRQLKGAAHLKLGKSTLEMNGAWGSVSDDSLRVTVINDYAFSFPQSGYDLLAYGGDLQASPDNIPIDYIRRENGYTLVVCLEPHGLSTIASTDIDAFNSANSYITGDLVDYNGFIYQALQNNPAVSFPPTNLSYWAQYTDDTKKHVGNILIENVPDISDNNGPSPGSYVYQTGKWLPNGFDYGPSHISDADGRYSLTSHETTLTDELLAGSAYRIVGVGTTDGVADVAGYIILDLNQDNEEGPVPYIGTLGNAILLSPSYKFKSSHAPGADVTFLSANRTIIDPLGSDYAFYVTGTAAGRDYCKEILEQVTALGINLEIVIVYPDSIGLGGGNEATDGSSRRVNDIFWLYSDGDLIDPTAKTLDSWPYWE